MTDSITKNEIYLSAGYIRRKGLRQTDIALIGEHKIAAYLKAASDQSGDSMTRFSSAADIQGTFSHYWYVLNAADYDEDDLQNAVIRSERSGSAFLCIILLQNIKESDTIQKYSEMELITAHSEQLGAIRKQLSG